VSVGPLLSPQRVRSCWRASARACRRPRAPAAGGAHAPMSARLAVVSDVAKMSCRSRRVRRSVSRFCASPAVVQRVSSCPSTERTCSHVVVGAGPIPACMLAIIGGLEGGRWGWGGVVKESERFCDCWGRSRISKNHNIDSRMDASLLEKLAVSAAKRRVHDFLRVRVWRGAGGRPGTSPAVLSARASTCILALILTFASPPHLPAPPCRTSTSLASSASSRSRRSAPSRPAASPCRCVGRARASES
jgi:hypothetical protein